MNCKSCHATLSKDDVYCNKCGTKNQPSMVDKRTNLSLKVEGIGQSINFGSITWEECKYEADETYEKGNYYEAIEYYQKALELGISDRNIHSEILTSLGLSYYGIRELEEYMRNLNLALLINPSNFVALTNRAILLIEMKDEKSAWKDIDLIVKNGAATPFFWYCIGHNYAVIGELEKSKKYLLKAIDLGYLEAINLLNMVVERITNK